MIDIIPVLIQERDKLVAVLKVEGVYYGKPYVKTFDATVWDINNGSCDRFAENVIKRLGGENNNLLVVWLDEICDGDPEDAPSHCVILCEGKYYDAECIKGVEDYKQLPIYLNEGKTREQVLKELVS